MKVYFFAFFSAIAILIDEMGEGNGTTLVPIVQKKYFLA
jgi:hypothetical protein